MRFEPRLLLVLSSLVMDTSESSLNDDCCNADELVAADGDVMAGFGVLNSKVSVLVRVAMLAVAAVFES